MERSRGVPDAELFLHKPAEEDCDSPTVEPLRIFKPQIPCSSVGLGLVPLHIEADIPSAPGASSSAAPLPYPDEEDLRPGKPTKPTITAPKRFGSDYNDITPRLNASPVETKSPTLAERRGTGPRPLGAASPQSPAGEDGGLFAKPLTAPQPQRPAASTTNYPSYTKKPYYPPPAGASSSTPPAQSQYQSRPPQSSDHLDMPGQNSIRLYCFDLHDPRQPGISTPARDPDCGTRVIPGGSIEARYAASGISGTATLTSLQAQQAQSAAASQRLAQYGGAPPPARPWTPTENPENQPHGPPTVYQGMNPVSVLEQDYQRLGLNDPPPAYSSVTPPSNSSYPAEKQRPAQQRADSTPSVATSAAQPPLKKPATVGPAAAGLASPSLQGHPAFANDPRPEQNGQSSAAQSAPVVQTVQTPASFQGAGPSSPPPLPEGWIAHLDQNSGQYYYIHLASQATQWEFPKGPNPMQHEAAPLSPTTSTYGNPLASPMFGKQSLGSPMFPPQTPGYAESIMSVAASQTPTTAGFSGPPPSAGVDMYRIQPTNGVYFGPYLRYCNMDFEKGLWLGSIMIVTDAPQPPTIHIHPSNDLSPNPRQLTPHNIFTHQRWTFYKYDIDLPMSEHGNERWTYAVTSHLGCTRYEFVIAGRHEIGWRFVAHSNNDFAASTSQAERSKLGGVGFMWKDVLQKNVDCGGFHVQLGLGNQIYGDRLWKEVPLLKQWLAMSGRDNRKNAQWTARHEEDVSHAYFHYYTSHFDQPYLREAFAQIPHVLQVDDHDM
ncbi:WW domain-containing protein [Colletotrichum higginsianum]|nr:WW domain-containing protein [Colletotrichum higginsianum]